MILCNEINIGILQSFFLLQISQGIMKLMSLMFEVPDEETLVNVGIALNHCLPGYTKILSAPVTERLVLVWIFF